MAETFNRVSVALATVDETDVYQAPNAAAADRAVVMSCLVANVDGAASADVTLTVTDAANAAIARLTYLVTVPPKSSLEVVANKVVLNRGEKIRATASAGGDLEVTVSALELTA